MKNRKIARLSTVVLILVLASMSSRSSAHAQGGQFVTIDDPNGVNGSEAYGINSSGTIVGSYQGATTAPGYMLHDATYTTINDPAGNGTAVVNINARGDIVGFYAGTGSSS